jgi:hypothetical protein
MVPLRTRIHRRSGAGGPASLASLVRGRGTWRSDLSPGLPAPLPSCGQTFRPPSRRSGSREPRHHLHHPPPCRSQDAAPVARNYLATPVRRDVAPSSPRTATTGSTPSPLGHNSTAGTALCLIQRRVAPTLPDRARLDHYVSALPGRHPPVQSSFLNWPPREPPGTRRPSLRARHGAPAHAAAMGYCRTALISASGLSKPRMKPNET